MKKITGHAIGLITALVLALCATAGLSFTEEAAAEPGSTAWSAPAEIRKDETGLWDYGILEDGTAVITGFSVTSNKLVFPDEVDGIPVTMLAKAPLDRPDYAMIRKIKTVTLPQGLTAVENLAFEYFAGVKEIKLPKCVNRIGYGAFRDCGSLTRINLPEGITEIGEEAFSCCRSLSSLTLPSTLEKVGRRAFYYCKKLGKVILPAAVRSLDEMAFAYCEIRSLSMNEGLEEIGDAAFISHRLREIMIPGSVRTVGNAAFHPGENRELKKVTFSGASVQPGVGMFGYDDGWSAYYRKCQKEQKTPSAEEFDRNDPKNWIDFYRDAANYGQNVLTVICSPGSTADRLYQYHVTKQYLQAESTATVAPEERVLRAGLYTNDDGVYELVIPEGVEEISDSAFAGLSTLNKVTLPATLTRIGAHAFEQCTGLKEIVMLGKTMSEIGGAAFRGCSELKSITIPEGVTEISEATFESCRKLKTVRMPKAGVVRIGDRAFAECAALADLALNAGLESIGTEAFLKCGVSGAQIPDSVTSIGKKAYYMSGLTRLKLPAVMEEIPEYLCAYSTKLAKLTLPKETKKIGTGAFMQCPVTGITLPEGLERIEEKAFAFDNDVAQKRYGRKKTVAKLGGLKIPASLAYIGQEAFTANDALSSVTFAKGSCLEEIGDNAFSLCFSLKSITLPDSLRKAGNGVFRRCVGLKKADLGSGITELGDNAFDYCLKLVTLTVPESLETIGKDLLNTHDRKLKVTCPEGSAMQLYLQDHYPEVTVLFPKK